MDKIFVKTWQKNIIKLLGISTQLQLFFFSIIIQVKGRRAPPNEAQIAIAAPHSSFFDAEGLLAVACRDGMRIRPVCPHHVANLFHMGALAMACNPISVDQKHHKDRALTSAQGDHPEKPDVQPACPT